ncbi:MAG: GAF domain-containing protein [Anaerolineae bacterium]
MMSSPFDNLKQKLTESNDHALQLRQNIDGVVSALTKRSIQINVDFDTTTKALYRSLDDSQKQMTSLAHRWNLMEELVAISALLTSSLELDQVLQSVLDSLIRLTGAERAYLMLMQPSTNELKIQVARNRNQENITGDDITFSEGVIETAISDREPVITTNAQSDARFEARQSVMSHSLRSIIVIPLFLGEEIIGVIYADNRIEAGIFRQDSISILSAYANQAAIAISNARLFEQVKDDLQVAQRKVEELQIQIDEQRVQQEVDKITDNEFFEELTEKVAEIRARHGKNVDVD